MDARSKILGPEHFAAWRQHLRAAGRRLVATNGCFDILHAGHVVYLEAARNHGDALLIGLNSDTSVRKLKGAGRPVNSETDRAIVLAGLECVSGVFIFDELRAVRFLEMARPDIYVKGGDYTVDTIPQEERRTVEGAHGRIVFLPFVPGKSTTSLLEKISQL